MSKSILFVFLFVVYVQHAQERKVIARQGKVAFFSYTSVENIKAENNQVFSIIDLSNGEIAVSMLMRAFVFEKALMREHFNESYVESDLYPKATFEGNIMDFDPIMEEEQTRMVHGTMTLHDVSKELEIKTKIQVLNGHYVLSGTFETLVDDYEIRVPQLLAGNIAKTITVDFRFEFEPYEK